MNRLAKIRARMRNPDGSWHMRSRMPMRGYGAIDSSVLPELPGYVTRDQCDRFIADTVVQEKESKKHLAAGVAIVGILVGFMFGRVTKTL